MYNEKYNPVTGKIGIDRRTETVRPATKQDIRTARKLATQQGLLPNKKRKK